MNVYGLIGYPLTHSFSKSFFTEKFEKEKIADSRYDNFSFKALEDAIAYLKSMKNLRGLNVTIPHKINVMAYLDEVSEVCQEIKSCNCIKVKDGKWYGHNTDVPGFLNSLKPLLRPQHHKALVFGTGGASKAVVYALEQLGIDYKLVSRQASRNQLTYETISEALLSDHKLLINTTPVGMFPEVEKTLPLPYHAVGNEHLAYDLIYNPDETLFLKKAKERGAAIQNGLPMLVLQAEESWRIWQEE